MQLKLHLKFANFTLFYLNCGLMKAKYQVFFLDILVLFIKVNGNTSKFWIKFESLDFYCFDYLSYVKANINIS